MTRVPSQLEKREAIDKVAYEIYMLAGTAQLLMRQKRHTIELDRICYDSILEAFLVAIRNLHQFLFPERKKNNLRRNADHIITDDFRPSWSYAKPQFIKGLHYRLIEPHKQDPPRIEDNEIVHIISQRLHHLCWPRVTESKISWLTSEILREYAECIEAFVSILPSVLKTANLSRAMQLLQDACFESDPRNRTIVPERTLGSPVTFVPNHRSANQSEIRHALMAYNHFTHRHNFAVWAAARAAQRRFASASVTRLKAALEVCGVVEFLRRDDALQTNSATFDRLHRAWCERIRGHLTRDGVNLATHGRAAKLIAVYLKAMVVIGPDTESQLARVSHPPIDRILLKNLSRASEINSPHKKSWAKLSWTQLDAEAYDALIKQLRECLGENQPMWHLEKYWTVTAS